MHPHDDDQPESTTPRQGVETIEYWLTELTDAKKREREFREEGRRILDIYAGGSTDSLGRGDTRHVFTPFNILYSNTETLQPALYSQVPRPVVERRYKDADPVGRAASVAAERMLEFLLDTHLDLYDTFDDGMTAVVKDALLVGRGVTVVKYDAQMASMGAPTPGTVPDDGSDDYAQSELVCLDAQPWDRVLVGYAKKWSTVPWIAYEKQVDRKEAVRLLGEDVAQRLVFTTSEARDREDDAAADTQAMGERKVATLYQIWDRAGGRKVRYLSEQYKTGFLKIEDDPLGLAGFFNCPKPLQFMTKPHDLLPVPLYRLYENQAKELNKIQRRINHIVDAMKARGIYDGNLGDDVEKLFSTDENGLVPAAQGATLAAQGGLEKTIWFMPLAPLQQVLQQLYAARESCKQVIYEITGISDIIRGASKASETLGAQQIKSQWGSLRLNRLQKEVQRYSRDLLRIMLEIAATKFSEETWAKMTGLPFITTQQQMQVQMIAQAAQMSGQPMDPRTQQMLGTPVWGQILRFLKDDLQRAYRIDIETNSTIAPEAAEDQKQLTELMMALGQALNGLSPLIEKGVLPFEVAKAILLTITRRFRFGSEIEGFIQQMQPPQRTAGQQDPALMKAQQEVELSKQQVQMSAKEAELSLKMKEVSAQQQLQQQQQALQLNALEAQQREQTLKMEASLREEQLSMKEKIWQAKVSAADKVRSVTDMQSKREQQIDDVLKQLLQRVEQLAVSVEQLTPMRGVSPCESMEKPMKKTTTGPDVVIAI